MSAPVYPVYPDLYTSSASNAAANRPEHRRGQGVGTLDPLATPGRRGLAGGRRGDSGRGGWRRRGASRTVRLPARSGGSRRARRPNGAAS